MFFNLSTVLCLLSSKFSIVKASFSTAKTPLSTPAEGSITYGTIHSLFSFCIAKRAFESYFSLLLHLCSNLFDF